MSARWNTALASLLLVVLGTLAFAWVTHGFRIYTTEGALRVAVQQSPRALPDARLQDARGEHFDLHSLRGRWLVVNFMYTRCLTVCSVQGAAFARMQRSLAGPIARDDLRLLSLSFDPHHDDPAALTRYKQRFGERGPGWIAARPTDAQSLDALLATLGVKITPDGLGGFEHNAAINLVNPQGQLVAILNWDDVEGAHCYLERHLDTAAPHATAPANCL